jgi:hypothetical protein
MSRPAEQDKATLYVLSCRSPERSYKAGQKKLSCAHFCDFLLHNQKLFVAIIAERNCSATSKPGLLLPNEPKNPPNIILLRFYITITFPK